MSVLLVLAGLLLPSAAYAQSLSDILRAIAGNSLAIPACSGPSCVTVLGFAIMNAFTPLIGIIATFIIIRAGFVLVYRGSDEELAKAKRSIASALTAIMLIFLAPRLTDIFYGGIRFGGPGTALVDPQGHSGILSAEIIGFLNWLTVLVAVGAVTVIILSGLRAIATFGDEQGMAQLKRTVFGVIAGIFILLFSQAILQTFGLLGGIPTPFPIIIRAVQIINGLLVIMTIIAVAVVVYAGLLMILNVGNEEKFGAAKNLIFRALIGLAVILVSLLLVGLILTIVGG